MSSISIKRYQITGNFITRKELMECAGYKSRNGLINVLDKIGFPKPVTLDTDIRGKVFYKIDEIIAFNKANPDKAFIDIKEL